MRYSKIEVLKYVSVMLNLSTSTRQNIVGVMNDSGWEPLIARRARAKAITAYKFSISSLTFDVKGSFSQLSAAQGVNQLSRYPTFVQTSISFHIFQELQSYGALSPFTSQTKEN